MKTRKIAIVFALMMALMALFSRPSMASPIAPQRHVIGSVGVETPIGMTPDRPQDNTPTVLGDLHLTNLVGPVGVFGSLLFQARTGDVYAKENRFKVGLEAPLGTSGLTVYSYFERRYDVADNRFMVGCRWGFNQAF